MFFLVEDPAWCKGGGGIDGKNGNSNALNKTERILPFSRED